MSGANFYETTTNRTRRTRCQMDTLCASLLAIVNGGVVERAEASERQWLQRLAATIT